MCFPALASKACEKGGVNFPWENGCSPQKDIAANRQLKAFLIVQAASKRPIVVQNGADRRNQRRPVSICEPFEPHSGHLSQPCVLRQGRAQVLLSRQLRLPGRPVQLSGLFPAQIGQLLRGQL